MACLDFDNVTDLPKLVSEVNKDKHTLSSFISPSGDGLKVLVKIPLVDNNLDYQDYYIKLQEHYSFYFELDESTKDLARATYVSSDPYLFHNEDSEIFTEKYNRVIEKTPHVAIPITDKNEIADRLEVWFKKRWSTTNRNTNLHAYARQMNAFGVDKMTCETYLLRYDSGGKENEILKLINSAYNYSVEFNSSSFEDSEKVRQVEKFVKQGQDKEYISKITGVSIAAIESKIDSIEVFDF